MQKWVKKHLNILTLITLVSIACTGISVAAVTYSDVQKLNHEVFGDDSDKSIVVKLAKQGQKLDDISFTVHKIEDYITQ